MADGENSTMVSDASLFSAAPQGVQGTFTVNWP
ncbi:MAG: hypothetical protein ACI867_000065, partial [Glaciecola sp.]